MLGKLIGKFCKFILTISGWKLIGQLPNTDKYVIIVAPHTSNWDFVVGILARGALGQKMNFLGKHQLFIKPWGYFFKALGGSPVNRSKHNNLVDTAVNNFKNNKQYKLALAPEGTRSKVKRWKTGFYYIAQKAQVPIIPVGLDFKDKSIIIAEPLFTGNNMEQDMNQLLCFFRKIKGRHPKNIPDFSL